MIGHMSVEEYRNRARRMERESAEMRERMEYARLHVIALNKHINAMADALEPFAKVAQLFDTKPDSEYQACLYAPAAGDEYMITESDCKRAEVALARYTAWLIDGE